MDNLNNEVQSNIENLELYAENHPFRLPLRVKDFENEAELKKFLKNCEKLVRGSLEYKYWRDYIKDILGVNTCMVTSEKMEECTIEVHHHIPSLYSLIKAIVLKNIEEQEEFSTFDISMEAIKLHFMNKVGYVTVIKSMHEKFHNGFLNIPIEYVKGDYRYFLSNYFQYLDESDQEVVNYRLTINESNCNWTRDSYPGLASQGAM